MAFASHADGPQRVQAAQGGLTPRQPTWHRSPGRSSLWGQRASDVESIVRDLHDLAINRLSRLAFDLSAVSNLVDGETLDRVMKVIDSVDGLVGDVRWFVLAGLERSTGDGDLEAGIRVLARECAERMGGTAEVGFDGDLKRLPPEVGHHLRAVVAEAVQNSAAHSSGSHVLVRVTVGQDQVVARVADDGRGPPEPPEYGLGLGSMASRARQLGGSFAFAPASGGGAAVTWRVPLPSTG